VVTIFDSDIHACTYIYTSKSQLIHSPITISVFSYWLILCSLYFDIIEVEQLANFSSIVFEPHRKKNCNFEKKKECHGTLQLTDRWKEKFNFFSTKFYFPSFMRLFTFRPTLFTLTSNFDQI